MMINAKSRFPVRDQSRMLVSSLSVTDQADRQASSAGGENSSVCSGLNSASSFTLPTYAVSNDLAEGEIDLPRYSISKQGDRYLRSLFTAGALAVIRYAKIHGTKHRPWLAALLARRPTKVAAIALANKLARMAWAMMAKGERYKQPAALAA
jgi:hypothetical protein